MLKKTKGVVINYIRYKETSIIVKIFTRELGQKSYLVNGVRSQGKESKIAIYQPLTLLELVVYDKETGGIQRISEVKISTPPMLIPFEFTRTSIALFITEVINRSIHEGYKNEWLFDFIEESILYLDKKEANLVHFPLVFLIEKARFLGLAPETAEGFLIESNQHPFSIEEIHTILDYLKDLLTKKFASDFKLAGYLRRKLLNHLLDYHSEHLEHPTPLKSLAIIRQIMD